MEKETLIESIDRVHTTLMGIDRIRRNLQLPNIDVVLYCRDIIINSQSEVDRKGKNWYISLNDIIITVNIYSCTIITAHRIKVR